MEKSKIQESKPLVDKSLQVKDTLINKITQFWKVNPGQSRLYFLVCMFGATPGSKMSEIASYRVTDLHQPKTVSLLATPVPKCPEDPNTRETDASGETEEDVESERLSDGVIQDVLKLLEGVDIGFLYV